MSCSSKLVHWTETLERWNVQKRQNIVKQLRIECTNNDLKSGTLTIAYEPLIQHTTNTCWFFIFFTARVFFSVHNSLPCMRISSVCQCKIYHFISFCGFFFYSILFVFDDSKWFFGKNKLIWALIFYAILRNTFFIAPLLYCDSIKYFCIFLCVLHPLSG